MGDAKSLADQAAGYFANAMANKNNANQATSQNALARQGSSDTCPNCGQSMSETDSAMDKFRKGFNKSLGSPDPGNNPNSRNNE